MRFVEVISGEKMSNGDDESFEVVALNDYKADLASELSLTAGEAYTVLQTSESGWWYAADKNGETGWVPSNFVSVVEEKGAPEPPAQPEEEVEAKEDFSETEIAESSAPAQPEKKATVVPAQMIDISDQTILDLLEYVVANANPDGDAFNMARSLRTLTFKISQEEENRRVLAQAGGFDSIVNVMEQTVTDIAVQISCLQAVALIAMDKSCAEHLARSTTSPLSVIARSLELIDHYAQHTILAFNTTCNVATNPIFRERARGSGIVNIIITRVLTAENQVELYTPASLALRNLLVDPGLRDNVSADLITVVTRILEESEDARTKTAACGILVNIAQDARLAKEMIDSGGFERLQDLLKHPSLDTQVKKTSVEVMHNLCITASKLDIDTVAVVTFLSSVLEMDELELQVLALKALSAYSSHCKDKLLLLRTLVETGALIQSLRVGLEMEEEDDKKIALNIICYLGQGTQGASLIATNVDLIQSMVRVAPSISDSQVIRNMLVLFFHISESAGGQTTLIDADVLDMMKLTKDPDAMQAFLGIIIRCAQNKANHEPLLEKAQTVKNFLNMVPVATSPGLKQYVDGCRTLLQQIEINNQTLLKQKRHPIDGHDETNIINSSSSKKPQPIVRPTNLYPNNRDPAAKKVAQEPSRKNRIKPVATSKPPAFSKPVSEGPPAPPSHTSLDDSPPLDNQPTEYYSYEDLRDRNFPTTLDRKKLESYLTQQEFQAVFGMPFEKFEKLKGWKRVQLKKRVKLF